MAEEQVQMSTNLTVTEEQVQMSTNLTLAEEQVQMSTLVFLDFEATGLNNGKTKITELALLSVQREELMTPHGIPRVINKLTLCVNPQKAISPRASEITGLYNENLESQSPFDGQVIDMMVSYLTRLPQPVCLIAHYGNGYDFRLLATELKKIEKSLPLNLYCADSIEAFRELDGLPRTLVTPNITPAKSPPNVVPSSDTESSSSTSGGCVNFSTPVGQHIPSDIECPGIKEKARLAKRKSDQDLHTVPLKAKACRKRLFESGSGGDEIDIKPLEGNINNDNSSDIVCLKSNDVINVHPDVVGVRKKLDFENLNSVNKSVEKSETNVSDNVQSETVPTSEQAKEGEHFFSQSSIPDDILLDAVNDLEENPSSAENVDKNYSRKESDVCQTEKETVKKPNCYNQVAIQQINTGMSYTLSRAEHHDKTVSYVTPSADHGKGPISSYETDHKHFPLHKQQSDTNVTPTKEPETVLPKMYFSSGNVDKNESKHNNNCGKDTHGIGETTPERPANATPTTPVTENQPNMNNIIDTPVSHFQPRVSYKLTEIYKRTFGHLPHVSHAAEDDCVTLMKVVKKRSPEFLHWVDKNAVLFSTITPF